jgi:hypothetical protein
MNKPNEKTEVTAYMIASLSEVVRPGEILRWAQRLLAELSASGPRLRLASLIASLMGNARNDGNAGDATMRCHSAKPGSPRAPLRYGQKSATSTAKSGTLLQRITVIR